MKELYHYTDKDGFNGIRATTPWTFKASQPPGNHPFGAYFTDYSPRTPNLAKKLFIPKRKLAYAFRFADQGDLLPLPSKKGKYNARGVHIFYSAEDYEVDPDERHGVCGKADEI